MLSTKNIFGILILAITLMFYFQFVDVFKLSAVDNVSDELEKLRQAYESAKNQTQLTSLKEKKNSLTLQQTSVLENFVPTKLHSGKFVYDLAQLANQNRLRLKNIQYTVIQGNSEQKEDKKMLIEFSVEGRYEDFSSWLKTVERGNILVDVENIRGVRNNPNSDVITFSIKLYTYAQNID